MRTRFLTRLLVGLMTLSAATSGHAQTATPSAESLLNNLGLPEITLTATDEGLEISPRKVPAGRYLVTLDNQSWNPDLPVEILLLDRDDPFICDGVGIPPRCFSTYHQAFIPGGVSGNMPQAILNLLTGRYGLWGPGEPGEYPAAILRVTGDPNAAIDEGEPETAAIVVTKGERGYGVAIRVEGQLTPGPQLIKVVNAADQPLFVAAAQDPEPSIDDEVADKPIFDASSDTISPLDLFNDTEFARFTSTIPQSANTTQWVVMDIVPGTVYVAAYIPDPVTVFEGSSGWYAATATLEPVPVIASG